MVVCEICIFGDFVLWMVCVLIEEIDDGVWVFVVDFVEIVEFFGRVGVVVLQIGVVFCVFSYNIDGDIGYVLNLVLIEVCGELVLIGEGCFFVFGLWYDVLCYFWVCVEGIDFDGEVVVLEGEGLFVQVLQYEIDYFDGKLFLLWFDFEMCKIVMCEVCESFWF